MNDFILTLFAKQDKLKASTLFHLLKGKQTSSVLLYGYFHELMHLNGLFPKLKEKTFYEAITELTEAGCLQERNGQLTITKTGRKKIGYDQQMLTTRVNFFKYGRRGENMWRMVQFFVQVVSNLGNDKRYLPIENSPLYTEPVRNLVRQYHGSLKERLYQELTQIFCALPQSDANHLARTLTGYQVLGAVNFQIVPPVFQESPWNDMYQNALIHEFLQELAKHRDFVLFALLAKLYRENEHQSMLETKKLILRGLDRKQVMQARDLKQGTINDHLILWALTGSDFPFERFLSADEQEQLAKLPGDYREWSYSQVTSSEPIDFLSFRLYQILRRKES